MTTRPAPARRHIPVHDALQMQIAEVWRATLGAERVGANDALDALGGTGADAEAIERALAARFNVRLSSRLVTTASTVAAIASELAAGYAACAMTEIQAGNVTTSLPLWFWHGDFNGGGFYVHDLSRHLGADVPFVSVPPHGIGGRGIPVSIEEMAADYTRGIDGQQLDGPCVLGGHCTGGLVALEVARHLADVGRRVALVALVHAWYGARPGVTPPAPLVASTIETTHAPGPPPNDPGWRLSRYIAATRRYVPRPYAGPVALFWPDRDAAARHEAIDAWRRVVPQLLVHDVPGDHLSCITTHAEALAQALSAYCRRSAAATLGGIA